MSDYTINVPPLRAVFVSLAVLTVSACASGMVDVSPVPAPAPAQPAAPAYQLNDILGARADAIDALFGSPALVRREGSGEFRRYALSACSLIVILYPDENGEPAAVHVEASPLIAGAPKPEPAACLATG